MFKVPLAGRGTGVIRVPRPRKFQLPPEFVVRLLLDSRVVEVPMAYNVTFVILSSLKPFLFKRLKNELPFSDNAGA